MYVGRKHTVTATSKEVMTFSCIHCNASSQAIVIGVGQGQGNSAYFLDESGAKQRAESSASSSADENALLTLSLARCPKCQRRDESAVSALKNKALLGAAATVVLFPLMGLGFDALKNTTFGIYIFAPLGVITAWVIWSQQKWKWETVDQRVTFLDPGADEPAP